MGPLRYFLGIEIAKSKTGTVIFQSKYALDLLTETGMLGCKHVDTPMDPNIKLTSDEGDIYMLQLEGGRYSISDSIL